MFKLSINTILQMNIEDLIVILETFSDMGTIGHASGMF